MSKFMRENKCEARPHGFRATFRTWVEEQTDTAFEGNHPVTTATTRRPSG